MVALYIRTSTSDKQDGSMQKNDLETFVRSRSFEVYKIYEALIKDARQGRFDKIIVWKLDRFARSLGDLVNMVQELSEIGVDFISFKDSLDLSTSQGRLMFHMIGAFAQFESDMIRMRVNAGLANARANGTRSGKPIGKPRKSNYEMIYLLRDRGLSFREISRKLEISEGSVQWALKTRYRDRAKVQNEN